MTEDMATEIAEIGVRLLDDAYMTWRAAALGCEQAQRAWFDAPGPDHQDRYIAYCASVDREEAAALDLQRLSELSRPCHETLLRSLATQSG